MLMNFRGITTALLLLVLLCLNGFAAAQDDTQEIAANDIAPYTGPIGPGSPLYGLKLALEDMDESFTANETDRVDKQVEHARLRLAEVRGSLDLNESDSAETALNNYWLKMNLTNATIARWSSNATGLLHAQEMIAKHQEVLGGLLASHPNNTGLMRAYNNSVKLEEKFSEKTLVMYNRTLDKNNRTILKAIRLEQKEHDRAGWPEVNTTTGTPGTTIPPTDDRGKGGDKDKENKGKGAGSRNLVSNVTTTATPPGTTTATTTPDQQGRGQNAGNSPDDKGSGNAGGNSGGQGKGNSKNK